MIIDTDALRAMLVEDLEYARTRAHENLLLGRKATSRSYQGDALDMKDMIASIKKLERTIARYQYNERDTA